MELTNEQIEKIKNRKIREAILTNGERVRIFFSTNGFLCQYKKGSRKYGWSLRENEIERLIESNKRPEKSIDEKTFRVISKFRKEALKASFTNDFIRDCIALPKTFDEWVADGKKTPYQYGITIGCKITGDLVSIESISKKFNFNYKELIKQAIKEQNNFTTGRFDYNGYDGSVSFVKDDKGDFRGYFAKEFRNCGNGYYYLLINDNYFIGYDVD
jgi:hypothetical protein